MKPTITKEQAEELETMRTSFPGGDEYILAAACDNVLGGKLAKLDIMTLAAALVNGYEVEKTPEEKVREYFEKTKRTRDKRHSEGDRGGRQFHNGVLDGIISTISILGIHIEEVNVH